VAWLIVQVAETTFEAFGLGPETLRFVIIVLAIGFLPVVIASWIFEWTPEGFKLDKDVDTSGPGSARSHRLLDRAIIVCLTLAVGVLAYDKFVLDPGRDEARERKAADVARSEAVKGFYGDRSIAVLPFINLSSDPEQEYFAEGISEEVLNLLARIRELRVISRSSAFAFKGKDLEIPEIARRLDVGHVLEGSVRKAGNMVRITAQLIEARTDTHLWSETYDRELENIFEIQDEIAGDVARNLELALVNPLPRSRVTDPEVIALTAQAKQLSERRDANLGLNMEALLTRALELDPDYVPALEWMSIAIWFLQDDGVISREEKRERDEQVRGRIRELDPQNAVLVVAEAWDTAYIERDLEKAASLFTKAVSRDPANSNLVRIASVFARYIGKLDAAEQLGKHAVAIDPLCYQCLYQLSRTYLYTGEYARAKETRERYLALGTGGRLHHALMMMLQGQYENAIELVETRFEEGDPQVPEVLVWGIQSMAYHSLGRSEDSDAALRLILEWEDEEDRSWILPDVLAWRGDTDELFQLLFEHSDSNLQHYGGIIFQPQYAQVRSDPRWTEWRESLGMSEERLNAIEFNPQLPE
jgi:TolB-like protein